MQQILVKKWWEANLCNPLELDCWSSDPAAAAASAPGQFLTHLRWPGEPVATPVRHKVYWPLDARERGSSSLEEVTAGREQCGGSRKCCSSVFPIHTSFLAAGGCARDIGREQPPLCCEVVHVREILLGRNKEIQVTRWPACGPAYNVQLFLHQLIIGLDFLLL